MHIKIITSLFDDVHNRRVLNEMLISCVVKIRRRLRQPSVVGEERRAATLSFLKEAEEWNVRGFSEKEVEVVIHEE